MADAYFDNVGLLVNFEADNGIGVPIMLDRSKYKMTLSAPDPLTAISTVEKRFGDYSCAFLPGGLTGLIFPINATDTHLNIGTGDFTVEACFFVDPNATNSTQPIVGRELGWSSSGDFSLYREGTSVDGKVKFWINGTAITIASDSAVSVGAWHHAAVCRISGVLTMFIDGVKQSSSIAAAVAVTTSANVIRIGYVSVGYRLRGYVDDIRITVGVGRYTANFTPAACEYPTDQITSKTIEYVTPVNLFQSPDFNSTNAIGVTYSWDLYFGGGGRISATVKEKSTPTNVPISRVVTLYSKETRLPVAETWSDKSGNYTFERISPNMKFFVVSFDHTKNYNAVIADDISPTPYQY